MTSGAVGSDHIAVELPGASALFTTRRGGVSSGPYESLNLGWWTDDDPAAVEHNRGSLQTDLGVRFAYGRQIHGARVMRVSESPDASSAPPESDGQATTTPALAPMVLTADCLPIALAGGGAVAMLHAGWRGLAGGVVEEGVRAVRELAGCTRLSAAIGPGAGPCCYRVSDEVQAVFASHGPVVRHGRNLDLKAVAQQQLHDAGVEEIVDVGLCTICSDASLFFSHRRDNGITGRQAGIVWLI